MIVYSVLQGVGGALCVIALVWAWRTRHQRSIWRHSRHDTTTAARVLELEEKVHELEQMSAPTINTR